MRFVVIYLVLAIIIYVRGICPVIHDRRKRMWCLLAVLPGAFFPSVTRFIGGSMVAPDLPMWVMYAGSIFQNFTLLVGILVIGREILSVPLRIIGLPFPYLGRSRIVAGTILGLSVAFSCLGMFKSVISLEVVEQEVAVKGLPAELDGLRIAQLSDLHVSSVFTRDRVEEIVERTNALSPDLIVLTGDFVDGTPEKRGYDLEPLKNLKAKYGVFGIEGNHEHYVDYDGWMRFMPTLGMTWLKNASVPVEINGKTLSVIGLTDPMAQRYGRELPDIVKASAEVPEQTSFRLLLSHQPKYAALYAGKADLMLSGHTHGGQVLALNPVVGKLNNGFIRGLYEVGDMKLYVNQGTDVWNGFLLRLGTVGEISLLTLKRAPEADVVAATQDK